MILMSILALMGEDDIGIDLLFQFFKSGFDFRADKGHEAVGKFLEEQALEPIPG